MPLGTVIGWCDGYARGQVCGWAWHPRQPHETVTVQLLINGELVGEAAACGSRPDLKSAGIGHGRHAFAIPYKVPPDAPGELRAVVRAKDGPVLNEGDFDIRAGSAKQRNPDDRVSRAELEAVFGSLTGDSPRRPPSAPVQRPVHFILGCAEGAAPDRGDDTYHGVMLAFRAVLRRLGVVHVAADAERDVDAIHAACLGRGEACFFLSFAPPHLTPLGLACPTIPVIDWAFGTIPDAVWDDETRHDWRGVLRHCGRAIALSTHAAEVIGRAMGPSFPVAAVPVPVWDRLSGPRTRTAAIPPVTRAPIAVDGFIWDSRAAAFWLGMTMPPIPRRAARAAAVPCTRGWRLALAEASLAAARAAETGAEAEAEAEAAAEAAAEAEAEAETAVMVPVADAAAELNQEAGAPKTLRHRAGLTRRMALAWYREVARDALPAALAGAMSKAGRLAWHVRAGLRAPLPTGPAAAGLPEPVTLARTEATPAAPTPRWHAAPDEPPLPEPVLAECVPDPGLLAAAVDADTRALVTLDGIVFTAVLAPNDPNTNWQDILSAFTMAFRTAPDATLVLRMIGADAAFWWSEFHDVVTRVPAFACRVVVLHGDLDEANNHGLIGATHFVTNAALAEGYAWPLQAFMSCHRPAVAPAHTAMADYVSPANAVIVHGDAEYCAWPHDPRDMLLATRARMDWTSLHDAFAKAYAIAKEDPDRYCAMGRAAAAAMQRYCGDETVAASLEDALWLRAPAAAPGAEMAA